jgi:transcription elongation factor
MIFDLGSVRFGSVGSGLLLGATFCTLNNDYRGAFLYFFRRIVHVPLLELCITNDEIKESLFSISDGKAHKLDNYTFFIL